MYYTHLCFVCTNLYSNVYILYIYYILYICSHVLYVYYMCTHVSCVLHVYSCVVCVLHVYSCHMCTTRVVCVLVLQCVLRGSNSDTPATYVAQVMGGL